MNNREIAVVNLVVLIIIGVFLFTKGNINVFAAGIIVWNSISLYINLKEDD